MNKLLCALLALVPLQAVANEEDPIAYKCYYCTESEMEDVALEQGVGRHYVYDYNSLNIVGFEVDRAGDKLVARPFAAEDWVKKQFKGMMALYRPVDGTMRAQLNGVMILAPDTEHGRTIRYLWGHHLSALHPLNAAARENVHRYLMLRPELSFLDTSTSNGLLLKLAHTVDAPDPIVAALDFSEYDFYEYGLKANFFFDHATRRWLHVDAKDEHHLIQQSRQDFAANQGSTFWTYKYAADYVTEAFIQRAAWALIPVHGEPSKYDWKVRCDRDLEDIQCYFQ